MLDAPKIDENVGSKVKEFIDKYTACALPDVQKYPQMNKLVRKMKNHHHTTTCRKKKGVTYRFNAPSTPSAETRIVRCEKNINKTKVKSRKKLIEKVLSYIVKIDSYRGIIYQRNKLCGKKRLQ